ncbi:hypothetical protein DIPPA_10122 [Diplonema papillatum]|nr:hypothetical protein DIPPA_10122 [Diplonema papillatum]
MASATDGDMVPRPTPDAAPRVPEPTPEERIHRFYEVQGMQAPPPQDVVIASTVTPDSEGAEELARVGAWKELVKLCNLHVYSNTSSCDAKESVRRVHLHAIALVKLDKRAQASDLLETLPREGLPFSIVLLRAELLADSESFSREASQQALYALLEEHPANQSPLVDRRRKAVVLALVSSHLALNQVGCAIKLLAQAAAVYPADPKLLHRYASLLMQTGHVDSARAVYDTVCALPPQTPQRQQTINILSGLLAICNGNFAAAEAAFSSGVTPSNCVNMNNKAVCTVYTEQLPNGIRILEEAVRTNPQGLTETAAANLFTLYDMESEAAAEKKKTLEAVATMYKGADFAERIKNPLKPTAP